MPHSMIVDAAGKRFCDDSYWVDIVARGLAPDDPHLPFFLVWDEQHHRKYGLGATRPGEPYPEELVTSAPALGELAAALGIDGAQLERTAASFSDHAAARRGSRLRARHRDLRPALRRRPHQRAQPRPGPHRRAAVPRDAPAVRGHRASAPAASTPTGTAESSTTMARPSRACTPWARAPPSPRPAAATTAASPWGADSPSPTWSPTSSPATPSRTSRTPTAPATSGDPESRGGVGLDVGEHAAAVPGREGPYEP